MLLSLIEGFDEYKVLSTKETLIIIFSTSQALWWWKVAPLMRLDGFGPRKGPWKHQFFSMRSSLKLLFSLWSSATWVGSRQCGGYAWVVDKNDLFVGPLF
eukprot:TRINITY_DN11445_c2_g1_i1.p1 TRINITY_DN11445_c2_g1~~TRINITY_DN11445_c2_g1_i1.p1  ORF type:complete len:100 (-),score=17.13 TRINITY_DN11445_c2_g1_i1:882-1181(-)